MKKEFKNWMIGLCLLCQWSVAIGQDFKTVGYLPTYRFNTIDNIELDKLTHLNISFANPDSQGNLTTDGVSITTVVEKSHAAGLVVFIALAGASAPLAVWEDWIKPENRSDFISGIMDYVVQHNLDGIDVDLEWGTVNDDYSGFVLELKDSVDQHGLKLSVALPGTYRYPEITAEALAAFEWVNLMAYDLTGPWDAANAGPHSPYLFAENSIKYWANQGLEKDKMTLGVPFYGYDFTNLNNVSAVTFDQMVNRNSAYAQVDQVGSIYYNGLPTITQKTELALNELSGIMIWELGQDDFGEYSLLNRINETITGFNTTSTIQYDTQSIENPYPNPVADFIQIKTNITEDIELTLFSPSLKRLNPKHSISKDDLLIDMRNYPKGVYFLTLKSDSLIKNFKLIKL